MYSIIISLDPEVETRSPHFIIPLVSDDRLCYSIQGYPELVFNLFSNRDYIINALFVQEHSFNGVENRTQVGKLAVIPRIFNASSALIFDSVKQEVILVNHKHQIAAKILDKVTVDETGQVSVKFIKGSTNQTANTKVHVEYAKPFATLGVSFNENHLDVDWNMTCDNDITETQGLIGMLVINRSLCITIVLGFRSAYS